METVTWLVVVAQLLGVTPEEVLIALLAATAGAVGGVLPGAAGVALRKLSEWLSSKPR